MRRLLSAVFALAAPALAASAAVAQDAPPLSGVLATDSQKAEMLIKAENWPELDRHGQAWIDKNIADWRGWHYRGVALSRQNNFPAAIEQFTKALELSPNDDPQLRLWLADAHAELGNWPESEEGYRRILRDRESRPAIWGKLYHVVVAQEGEDKRREEVAILDRLLGYAAHINDPSLWRRHAELLESFGENSRAREAYGHVLRLQPADLPAAEWAFQHDVAIADAKAIAASQAHLLKLNPSHPLVNLRLGDQAFSAANKRLARKYYEMAAKDKLYPRAQARALTALGRLAPGGAPQDALDQYLQAIDADPSYLPGWKGAVVAFRGLNQHDKASAYLSRMLSVERKLKNNEPITVDVLLNL